MNSTSYGTLIGLISTLYGIINLSGSLFTWIAEQVQDNNFQLMNALLTLCCAAVGVPFVAAYWKRLPASASASLSATNDSSAASDSAHAPHTQSKRFTFDAAPQTAQLNAKAQDSIAISPSDLVREHSSVIEARAEEPPAPGVTLQPEQ